MEPAFCQHLDAWILYFYGAKNKLGGQGSGLLFDLQTKNPSTLLIYYSLMSPTMPLSTSPLLSDSELLKTLG